MKSHNLSKSDISVIIDKMTKQWHIELSKSKTLILHEIDDNTHLITGDNITSIQIGDSYLPFLSETALLEKFPKAIVDAGAIKFVCNGANVMRPGIKKFTDFQKDDIICVVDEVHNKFLAVGKALMSSAEMSNITKGEVVKNLHYISDKYWEAAKIIKK
ncbi:PUA domain-containing protein [Candidatus Nitrosotalea okcheonensis]|uniref:PUA domain-containing protein n=1 Tax=Candidatus Nitrosotalea okcheonensis TaxID=1903276 RepID=A0A2H1FE64_9ARCH|nr:PUA domain-containing protein [Candidatus Nitrosotalea okcheonensis]SMH71047.1 PUA domain-containing protein [Candidatus Nitrosotalea okcheonensis]